LVSFSHSPCHSRKVEYLAAQAGDHLDFGVRRPLEVHTADRARQPGQCSIDLDDAVVAAKHGLKILLAK
jgi:hypothetical protein